MLQTKRSTRKRPIDYSDRHAAAKYGDVFEEETNTLKPTTMMTIIWRLEGSQLMKMKMTNIGIVNVVTNMNHNLFVVIFKKLFY